ncbi:MAG: hypothetical protein B6245_12235 [Desulfobacteraceae bacterium 4572_88]|nr:MAG: hypothetical protein B6245_12235 [Desulfobacteraceae bacterium 4572_88]
MTRIQDYEIREKLYESSQSVVYRVCQKKDNRPVILKILREEYPTPEQIAGFRREYEMTRGLDADGIIRAFHLESYRNSLLCLPRTDRTYEPQPGLSHGFLFSGCHPL